MTKKVMVILANEGEEQGERLRKKTEIHKLLQLNT